MRVQSGSFPIVQLAYSSRFLAIYLWPLKTKVQVSWDFGFPAKIWSRPAEPRTAIQDAPFSLKF